MLNLTFPQARLQVFFAPIKKEIVWYTHPFGSLARTLWRRAVQVTVNNPAFNYYYSALPQPALTDTRLKDRDRRLLAAFYLIAGRGNIVYNKTREDLGKLARMAKNAVSVTSARLVELGWLKKSGSGGRRQSAVYELTIPEAFTHLQRSANQTCRVNTTPQHSYSMASKKTLTDKRTLATPTTLTMPASNTEATIQNNNNALSPSLIYPNGLDQSFANALLVQLADTQQQVALDEWLGQVNSYRERSISVHSPNGLFRSIVKALLAGNSVQHASLVKQRRERAQIIASVIEQPTQKNKETEQPKSPVKRFAPGELKAKLLAEINKCKQDTHEQKPVIPIEKTRHTSVRVNEKNPSHFRTGFLYINTKPTKILKTTTTVTSENNGKAKKHSQKSGGGNVELNSDSTPNSATNQKTGSVGPLADRQSQRWSLLTKFISSCRFVYEPTAQLAGRGQLTSCPPHQLSPTSSTRPDALRFPKQINNIFSHPLKDEHAQKVSIHPQYGSVSSESNIGTDEEMSRDRIVGKQPAVYRDIPCCQRVITENQAGNRAKSPLGWILLDKTVKFIYRKINDILQEK